MSPKTLEIIEALKVDTSEYISAGTYSWAFGRSHVPVAFAKAKKLGIITVRYISAAGTPVYLGPSSIIKSEPAKA